MVYSFQHLNPRLVLITWTKNPSPSEATLFINDLKTLLEEEDEPVYFISDLRRGRIIDMRIIQELGKLTEHKNWAGSTAFSSDFVSRMFVKTFQSLGRTSDEVNSFFDRPEDAIRFLESLQPELTSKIDWHVVLQPNG